MRLDIAFNRKAALKAGIEVKRVWVDYSEVDGPEYEEELVRVPDMKNGDQKFWIGNGAVDKHGDPSRFTDIVLRTNSYYGHTYKPLTAWLKEKGIEWGEY